METVAHDAGDRIGQLHQPFVGGVAGIIAGVTDVEGREGEEGDGSGGQYAGHPPTGAERRQEAVPIQDQRDQPRERERHVGSLCPGGQGNGEAGEEQVRGRTALASHQIIERGEDVDRGKGIVPHAAGLHHIAVAAGQHPHPPPRHARADSQPPENREDEAGQEEIGDDIRQEEEAVGLEEDEEGGHQPLEAGTAVVLPLVERGDPVPSLVPSPVEDAGEAVGQVIVVIRRVEKAAEDDEEGETEPELRHEEAAAEALRAGGIRPQAGLFSEIGESTAKKGETDQVAGSVQFPDQREAPAQERAPRGEENPQRQPIQAPFESAHGDGMSWAPCRW